MCDVWQVGCRLVLVFVVLKISNIFLSCRFVVFFEGVEVGGFMRRVYACLFYVCVWLCFAILSVLICGVLLGVGIVSLLKYFVFFAHRNKSILFCYALGN